MRAAVVREIGGTPHLEDVAEPVPADGRVLVRVLAAPINAVDRSRVAGTHYSRPELPAIVGFVGAGEVDGGRRVLFVNMEGPSLVAGSMAELVAVDPARLIPVPDGLDPAVAAAAFNPGMSAWFAVHHRGPVEPGSRVLIQGATGVTGKLAVQLAKRSGAGYVVATGRNEGTLDELRTLGADATIRVDQPDDALERAYRDHAGDGWDLVIDYLWGRPTEVFIQTLIRGDAAHRNLRTRLIQVGAMAGPDIRLPASALRSSGLEIAGMGTGTGGTPEQYAAAIRDFYGLLRDGVIVVDIDAVPVERVHEVWHREQGGRRPVITF